MPQERFFTFILSGEFSMNLAIFTRMGENN